MPGRTLVNINGYTVDDDVTLSDDLINISMGATLVLLGTDALVDDAIEGAGRVSGRYELTIDDSLALSGSTQFVNTSGVLQNGALLQVGQAPDGAAIARNTAEAVWTLQNGAEITGAGSSEFVNLGLFDQIDGTSTIDANFYDRGGIIVADGGGTLVFASPGFVNRFIDDRIEGTGTFEVDDHGVLINSNISTLTTDFADARIVGAVHVSSQDDYVYNLNLGAGSVLTYTSAAANVTLDGEIIGAGTIAVRGNDSVYSPNEELVGDVTFANYGNATFRNEVSFSTTPWTDDTVTIENETGATWVDTGSFSTFASDGTVGTAVFVNHGTFIEDTSSGVIFGMNVENDGVMEASASYSPSFVFSNSLTGAGVVEIGPDNVTLGGAAAASQTLNFNTSATDLTPTLTLNDPGDFAATISGFDIGAVADDKITLNSTSGSAWQLLGYQSADGALDFANGTATAAITLAGVYNAADFHAAVSGNQTTITYSV